MQAIRRGESPPSRGARAHPRLVAPTDANAPIQGLRHGQGARVLRDLSPESPRRTATVRVNCAAILAELYESEFFGHTRGVTGATATAPGASPRRMAARSSSTRPAILPAPGQFLRVLQRAATNASARIARAR
ncbi:MAG: sigma 54-interacting transcriptional regulator [Myxococcota bacterium]